LLAPKKLIARSGEFSSTGSEIGSPYTFARWREQYSRDRTLHSRAKHVERADHIRLEGVVEVVSGSYDARLRREVIHQVCATKGDRHRRWIADIGFDQAEPCMLAYVGDVFQPTLGEIIANDDIYCSISQETINQVAANEASSASNDHSSGGL
jgi:hypothetical protein